ncbi:hypothetical protein RISK_000676 [Rhodopirellula islandica]|uniref:Uncharacterized protein n=1 Tax=Rhodopirellula islandica TaxID=595434 RepID=A0A0J1BMC2_RHOIS|nr:hypothetical protein RISK_000676 [Rhodopirellula islandica]
MRVADVALRIAPQYGPSLHIPAFDDTRGLATLIITLDRFVGVQHSCHPIYLRGRNPKPANVN